MADSDSKRHWLPIAIPIALIVVLLPVAIIIGLNVTSDEDNETEQPNPSDDRTVAVSPPAGEGPVVVTRDLAFEPQNVTAGTGEVVTFQNPELTTHEVDFGDGDTYELPGGESFEWSEDEPGKYDYVCLVHPEMTGSIEVTESDE